MIKFTTISALSACLLIAAPATGTASHLSAETAASTLAKVREHVAGFRKAKADRDVIRSPHASTRTQLQRAQLDSRLVYDNGARSRIYLAINKDKLCFYEVSKAHGFAAAGCQPANDVLSGRYVLLYMSIGAKTARIAALALDGSSKAQEKAADGTTKSLPIKHNVIVGVATGAPVTVSWISPTGKRIAYPYFGPGTI